MFKMTKWKEYCEKLTREKDRLTRELDKVQCENAELKRRMQAMLDGDMCEGSYCHDCKHRISDPRYHFDREGRIVSCTELTTCALRIPCSKFSHKGG